MVGSPGDLVIDSTGNSYGTTTAGGASYNTGFDSCPQGCGTIFELSRQNNGGFTYAVLYSFVELPRSALTGHIPKQVWLSINPEIFMARR